jgi:phosphopentomutase
LVTGGSCTCGSAGHRKTYADMAATVARHLDLPRFSSGTPI